MASNCSKGSGMVGNIKWVFLGTSPVQKFFFYFVFSSAKSLIKTRWLTFKRKSSRLTFQGLYWERSSLWPIENTTNLSALICFESQLGTRLKMSLLIPFIIFVLYCYSEQWRIWSWWRLRVRAISLGQIVYFLLFGNLTRPSVQLCVLHWLRHALNFKRIVSSGQEML